MVTKQDELKALEQQARTRALLSSDVARERENILSKHTQQETAVRTQISRPDLEAKEKEIRAAKESDRKFWLKAMEGNPSNLKALQEKFSENQRRHDLRLKAVRQAKEKGVTYQQAYREEKRAASRGQLSTNEQLERRAAQGDEEAAAILKNKARWLAKAQFSTRVIPKYDGPTSGKTSGVYTSPLTGRPVLVREGGATTLPPNAQAKFTDPVSRPSRDLWTRDYTVYAKVSQPATTPLVTAAAPSRPPQEPTQQPKTQIPGYEGLYAPPESVAAEWRTNLLDSSTDPRVATPTISEQGPKTKLVLEYKESPKADLFTGDAADYEDNPRVGPFVFTLEGGDALIDEGRSLKAKSKVSVKEGEYLTAAGQYGEAQLKAFAGGTRNLWAGVKEDPFLTIGIAGVYYGATAAGTAVGGPAGGAAAAGGVFSVQNVIEAKTGQTPTVVRWANQPGGATFGEIAPFIALEGARAGTVSAFKSRTATARTQGETATPALLDDPIFTRDLSVEVRGDPVTSVVQQVATVEKGGVSRGFGTQKTVTGDPVYLTDAQIKKLPWTFITETNVRQATATQTLPSSKPGLTTGIEYGEVSYSTRGRTTIKEVQQAADAPVYRFDVRESDVNPGTVRLTRSQAETTFTPYEPPATSELTVTGAKETGGTGTKAPGRLDKTGGQLNEPPAKLDFFESIVVESDRGVFAIQESPYTGALRTGGTSASTPFIVSEIIAKPSKQAQAKGAAQGAGTGSGSVVEVEVPQSDGTVKVQQVKVEFEPPAQETKTKTETQTVQEEKAQAKKKSLQEQRTEASQSQTVAFKKYDFVTESGKTINEAIVKFKGLTDALNIQGLRSGLGTGQRQGQKERQDTRTSPGQLLEYGQALDQPVAFRQATRQNTRQEQAQDQGRLLDLYTPSRGLRPGDAPVEDLVPKTTGRFKFPDREKNNSSFDLLVRRRGKFIKAGGGLGFKEAAQRGALITGTTAAASFKLRGDKKVDARETLGLIGPQFRRSKRSPDVFVERSKFRIDTPGEVGEISRKGQAVSRKKKTRGRFKWVF